MAGFSISRKDLYEEIWSSSVTKVAEQHELSYTKLLSACRKNNIPVPPKGYSTKIEFGKNAERIPLPDFDLDIVTIESPSPTGKGKRNRNPALSVDDPVLNAVTPDDSDDRDKVPLLRYGDQYQEEREKLYQQVWEKPVSEVAKDYHISDVALRKRCTRLEVPLPERGYWAKLKAGKPVHKQKLGKMTASFPKMHTGEKRRLHITADALSFMRKADRQEVLRIASILRVGGSGAKLLDNIQKMQDDFQKWHKPDPPVYIPGQFHIARRREPSTPPLFASEVSPKTSSRVFHILDDITRALKPYSGSLSCQRMYCSENQYMFVVNGENVSFSISEEKDRVVHEITRAEHMEVLQYKEAQSKGRYAIDPDIPKYDYLWSGRLKMTIADTTVFTDNSAYVLEDRIGEILIALYEASYPSRVQRLQELEQLRKEIEELDRLEEEREKERKIRDQYNQEIEKTKVLLNRAADYETACRIRKLIDAVRNDPDNPDNNPEWLEWATRKADWFDPITGREDEFFGIREHDLPPDKKKLEPRW